MLADMLAEAGPPLPLGRDHEPEVVLEASTCRIRAPVAGVDFRAAHLERFFRGEPERRRWSSTHDPLNPVRSSNRGQVRQPSAGPRCFNDLRDATAGRRWGEAVTLALPLTPRLRVDWPTVL